MTDIENKTLQKKMDYLITGFEEIKTEFKEIKTEFKDVKNTVKNLESKIQNDMDKLSNTVERKIGNLWWQVGLGLIAGFYLITQIIDDKVTFMNEQYSDRFSRIETGLSLSSPEVLALINKMKEQNNPDKKKPAKLRKK